MTRRIHSQISLCLCCALLLPAAAGSSWWQLAPASEEFILVDLASLYHGNALTAGLGDGHRIDKDSLPPERSLVSVGGIPFHIGNRSNGDHLDVGLAKWPEVDEDPQGFYSHYAPQDAGDPQVPVVRLPKQNYSAAYLLCIADISSEKTPVVSLRLGLHDKYGYLYDTSVRVPRWNEEGNANAVASGEVQLIKSDGSKIAGKMFIVRAPLRSGDTQELRDNDHLDLELTKELEIAVHQPDPNRFRIRPLGLPSAVHVFGLSLQRSPVQMTIGSQESGNVFVEPQQPAFQAYLRNITGTARSVRLAAEVTDYYGQVQQVLVETTLAANADKTLEIPLPQERRGWFDVTFRLLEEERQLLDRNTTFALLPPDTRRASHRDSPFGTWYFGQGHRGTSLAEGGPLLQKAGIRKTLPQGPPDAMRQFDLTQIQFRSIVGTHRVDEVNKEALERQFEEWPDTDQALVFHESNIGPIMTHPAFLLGQRPEPLDEATQEELERRWQSAVAASRLVREVAPRIKLVFGNMTIPAIEQYLSRGYPPEYIDYLGEESPAFMRMPERQPEVAGFASLWWLKEMAKHYGYGDRGVTVSFEWMYHSTNPGNNAERTASDYNIRDCLLALAYGSLHVNPALIHDVGNAYYFSNWGASGLCRRPPELNPKPGYISFATMTLVLDQAKFSEKLETGSTSVYALEFTRPDTSRITALWTIRGQREVKLALADDGEAVLWDAMGNQTLMQSHRQVIEMTIGSSPVYITGVDVVRVNCGRAHYPPGLAAGAQVVDKMETLDAWTVEAERDEDFEEHIWDQLRHPGKLKWENADDATRGKVLRVALDGKQAGPSTASFYNRLRAIEPKVLRGEPQYLGLWVDGNSSWARITFELVDAEGETWSNIGAAAENGLAAWNTNDTESTTFVNFDGWRQLAVALPGQYPFDNYHWPRNCNWRHRGGNGLVDYPLKLTPFWCSKCARESFISTNWSRPRVAACCSAS